MKSAIIVQVLEVVAGLLFVGIAGWRLFLLARRPKRSETTTQQSKRPTGR